MPDDRKTRIKWLLAAGIVSVAGLVGLLVLLTGQNIEVPADVQKRGFAILSVKKALTAYAIQHGGYPARIKDADIPLAYGTPQFQLVKDPDLLRDHRGREIVTYSGRIGVWNVEQIVVPDIGTRHVPVH